MTAMEALPEIVTQHLEEVRGLCEKYRVKRLAIFGSAVKGTFDPETSDLDFVVEFFPQPRAGWGDVSFRFQAALQELFGRDVDVVERRTVRNPYFLEVLDLSEQPLYVTA
jgi:predicted nucleotidyltransferase